MEGTLAVLRAALKHKVKRVVITSSGLTITVRKPESQKEIYTEEDWSDAEVLAPYEKSKLLAEKAAWAFMSELPKDDTSFELVYVVPGLVQGPSIIQGEFSSANYLKMMLMGVMPALPKVKFPIVDVRNVAEAHLQGVKVAEAKNQRFILCNRTFTFKELCEILKHHYGEKYPIKTNEMAECPPDNLRFKAMWEKNYNLDNSKSVKVLGIQYKPIEDTMISMAEGMIEAGMLPDNRQK